MTSCIALCPNAWFLFSLNFISYQFSILQISWLNSSYSNILAYGPSTFSTGGSLSMEYYSSLYMCNLFSHFRGSHSNILSKKTSLTARLKITLYFSVTLSIYPALFSSEHSSSPDIYQFIKCFLILELTPLKGGIFLFAYCFISNVLLMCSINSSWKKWI